MSHIMTRCGRMNGWVWPRRHQVMEIPPTSGLLRSSSSENSVFCFWHTVQNHCFQDPKVETRGRRFVHNSTLQSHALMSGRFSSGISFTDLLKKILWSVGMMIVVGGVCLPRQMSRGFGNNQTEEWMFSPLGFSDKREYTFILKNRSSWWF